MNETRESDNMTDSPPSGERPKRGRGSRQKPPAAPEEPRQAQGEAPRPAPGTPDLPISWGFRGFLVTYVLLLLSAQRAHGYFIEQYLRGLGLVNVELSSLYRTLRQLEGAGLVTSSWEHGPDGPARRVYSLTEAGRWWLDTNATVLEGYRTLLDRFFGSYSARGKDANKND
ncbi:MAG: helix-turn-helix transcriptional regulator [Chloroflexota bacterium]